MNPVRFCGRGTSFLTTAVILSSFVASAQVPMFSLNTVGPELDLGTALPSVLTYDFTVDFWVKPGSTQEDYADILDFNHRANLGMVIQQDGNITNRFGFSIGDNTTASNITYQLQADVWQHVSFQREGSTLRLYINGNLVASKWTFNGPIYYLLDSSATVGYNLNYGRHFNGSIRSLRIFPYATTPTAASRQTYSMPGPRYLNSATGTATLGTGLVSKITGDFNIEMWVKPSETQEAYADIIDFNHRANMGLVIQQDGDRLNRFGLQIGNGATSATIYAQLTAGQWQHVRFMRSGATLYLFVNKEVVATEPCFSGPITYLPGSSVTLGYNVNYGRYFNGVISDFSVSY